MNVIKQNYQLLLQTRKNSFEMNASYPGNNSRQLVSSNWIYSHMKNKSIKVPFMTKNTKHLVRTICSQMKNKSLKLPFVTKNSKHLVGTSGDDVSALSWIYSLVKNKGQITVCNLKNKNVSLYLHATRTKNRYLHLLLPTLELSQI